MEATDKVTSSDRPDIRMIDVTQKEVSAREAIASCSIHMAAETVTRLLEGKLKKGNALEVARVAAVTGAKKTPDLVPLCHPIALGAVETSFHPQPSSIDITVTVRTTDRTGVEMEALVGAAAAALTIYDMVKSIDRGAVIKDLRLLRKSGGRSGIWRRDGEDGTGSK